MNEIHIDEIKDIATTLMDKDPELAYRLFAIVKEYRPNGPFIKKSYRHLRNKLKEKLGIKTFVVVGNCQVGLIANLISEKSDKFEIEKVVPVHRLDGDISDIYTAFDRCDYIIAQNINANFFGIDTDGLKARYPTKVVKILNLYFTGFFPDWIYMPKINNLRYKSPIGDYHNKTILDSFIEGVTEDEAVRRYHDKQYNQVKYASSASTSLNNLKNRELSVDIKMIDLIQDDLNAGVCSFHTFNHPNKKLLNNQVHRILDHLLLDYNKRNEEGDCLDRVKLRINPIACESTSTETVVEGKELNMVDFAKESYVSYSENTNFVNLYIKYQGEQLE